MLSLDLWLLCSFKNLENLFQLGEVDPMFKSLKFGCQLGSEEDLVWFLPTRFNGRLSYVSFSEDPFSRFCVVEGSTLQEEGSWKSSFTWWKYTVT